MRPIGHSAAEGQKRAAPARKAETAQDGSTCAERGKANKGGKHALTTYLHRTFISAEARIVCDFRQVTACNSWDIRKFAPNIEIQKVYDDSKRNTRSLQTLL